MNTSLTKTTHTTQPQISAGWVLFGISFALWLGAIAIQLITPMNIPLYKDMKNFGDLAEAFVDGVGFLAFGLVGAMLLQRGNRAGWAYLVPAVCYNTGLITFLYAGNGLYVHPRPLAAQAGLLMNALFLPAITSALVLVPILYPSGRPSRVWKILFWIMVILVVVTDVLFLMVPGPVNAPDIMEPNPWGVPALKPVIDMISGITLAAFIGLAIASAVCMIWRWRKAAAGKRHIYGIFLVGELIFLVMFLSDNVMQPILPVWAWLAPLIAVPAIPVATYLALLRGPKLVLTAVNQEVSGDAASASHTTPAD